MDIIVDFPGGDRVDAHFGNLSVPTDQPPTGGGEGSAPTPFMTFLASIGTCAGIYVLEFCKQRGLSVEGVRVLQRIHIKPGSHGMVEMIELKIQVPPSFPDKYFDALVRSANQCLVKKHLESPPQIDIHTEVMEN